MKRYMVVYQSKQIATSYNTSYLKLKVSQKALPGTAIWYEVLPDGSLVSCDEPMREV